MPCEPCGCDLEANWMCQNHQKIAKAITTYTFPGKTLTETIVTDPTTGGKKAQKLARFDLIPADAMWALAEVYGAGCAKYEDRNWEKGYAWGLSVAALERHLNLWKRGKSWDTEGEGATGCHHLMQVAWHAIALFVYELRGLGTDNVRPK